MIARSPCWIMERMINSLGFFLVAFFLNSWT
uniref:Uncharacterized protein n=1 Tax=Oryza glumipatula TaxID=40148 RepID=A0A0D9ZSB8_9ORYZ